MLRAPLQSLDAAGFRCGIYMKNTTRRSIPQGFFHAPIAEAFEGPRAGQGDPGGGAGSPRPFIRMRRYRTGGSAAGEGVRGGAPGPFIRMRRYRTGGSTAGEWLVATGGSAPRTKYSRIAPGSSGETGSPLS